MSDQVTLIRISLDCENADTYWNFIRTVWHNTRTKKHPTLDFNHDEQKFNEAFRLLTMAENTVPGNLQIGEVRLAFSEARALLEKSQFYTRDLSESRFYRGEWWILESIWKEKGEALLTLANELQVEYLERVHKRLLKLGGNKEAVKLVAKELLQLPKFEVTRLSVSEDTLIELWLDQFADQARVRLSDFLSPLSVNPTSRDGGRDSGRDFIREWLQHTVQCLPSNKEAELLGKGVVRLYMLGVPNDKLESGILTANWNLLRTFLAKSYMGFTNDMWRSFLVSLGQLEETHPTTGGEGIKLHFLALGQAFPEIFSGKKYDSLMCRL